MSPAESICSLQGSQTVRKPGLRLGRGLAVSLDLLTSHFVLPFQAHQSLVVDHYENPRNVGSLDKKSKNVGTGLVGAPACGDVMKLQIQVDEKGKIVDARFKTFGCGSAIASSSLATEWVKGKTVEEALTIKNTDIAKELCLPPVKLHCSMLAEDAIKAALADYKLKQDTAKKEEGKQEEEK
ncbi:iron-sulfur cluster assembly enzyme ISCU isoform X1 [Notamacropus eugenii]|uniref:iron-sulfur cluster assembly enzyme ISCU isoform X1 n=1 Tax=Notamacropus eugenii TaxID=9315 RepID=UPI003B6805D4